jgi:hypothetical protein
MCAIAAPARAAPIADAAICCGVTGMAGCLPIDGLAPVTAQVRILFISQMLPGEKPRVVATALAGSDYRASGHSGKRNRDETRGALLKLDGRKAER